MSDWQDILRSQNELQPGPDFEERVFSKIRKKKKLRKIGFSVTAVVSILFLFSLLQIFHPAGQPERQTAIQTPSQDKEEIPLHEDLFFSASDYRTRYSLEPVSLQQNTSAINQI
ncbi:MAG: hypothetical protein JXI33_06485 [Candidatus Aminicenantes bacterium]|nr:hypothetical protein [Candidatus Aminicenantes bacterium]